MNIPGYDAWRLRGPDERPDPVMEDCPDCNGTGQTQGDAMIGFGVFTCAECEGTGEVEATAEEPDGDYEYERRRDAGEDRG